MTGTQKKNVLGRGLNALIPKGPRLEVSLREGTVGRDTGEIGIIGLPSGVIWDPLTYPHVALFQDGGAHSRAVYLPSFLPQDATYVASVGGYVGSDLVTQYAVIHVGESASIPYGGEGGVGFWNAGTVLALVTIAAVTLVLVVVWVRRRAVRGPPPGPPPGAA